MPKTNAYTLLFFICITTTLLFIGVGYSLEKVVPIEFFYFKPCAPCYPEEYENFLHNNQTVAAIQSDYGPKVLVERIERYSREGLSKTPLYGIPFAEWYAIVINHETVLMGEFNETYVREIIDAYLTDSTHDIAVINVTPSNSTVNIGEKVNITAIVKNFGIDTESFEVYAYCNETLIGTQQVTSLSPKHKLFTIFVWDTTNQASGSYILRIEAEPVLNETIVTNNKYIYGEIKVTASESPLAMFLLAFSLGFFETFSPCLIILLSFVLSYTIGKASHFKESFSKVMTFGAGFLFATLLLGLALGLTLLSMPTLQQSLIWVVCIFALILGLNLLGVLRFPSSMSFQSKPLVKKLAGKYVFSYGGLFLLGFIFYFLDPCIAPIFVSMMPLLFPETLLLTLFVFCLGAIIPFIAIGFFAGSISELARSTYRHQSKIRAISGLILISYSLYLIFFYLVL